MKILITGANGFLGHGIVKTVLDSGQEVVAADFSTQYVDSRAERKDCNLFALEDPFEYFGRPDTLLHLAWRDGFVHNSDAHFEDFSKHYMFLKKMAMSDIKKIAVMGSMHEIGFFEGCVDENTPCHPENFYGIAKNALRDLAKLLAQQYNKIFQWLRGYYIVSNSPLGSSIFSKIAKADAEGKQTFPFTRGVNQFDFIDYWDFCKQITAVIKQDNIDGIINICSGYPEKLADRVERFIQENGYNIKLEYGKFPDRPYDSKAIWGNSSKIECIMRK